MDSAEKPSKRRKFDKAFCPHCKKVVAKSTWYLHYNKFYNKSTKTWQVDSSQCEANNVELDFDFDEATNSTDIDVDCQVEDFPTVYADELSSDESNFEFSDNDINVSKMHFAILFMQLRACITYLKFIAAPLAICKALCKV